MKPAKCYAMAITQNICFGHGDYRDVEYVESDSPIFLSLESAKAHKKKVDEYNFYHIKELELHP